MIQEFKRMESKMYMQSFCFHLNFSSANNFSQLLLLSHSTMMMKTAASFNEIVHTRKCRPNQEILPRRALMLLSQLWYLRAALKIAQLVSTAPTGLANDSENSIQRRVSHRKTWSLYCSAVGLVDGISMDTSTQTALG